MHRNIYAALRREELKTLNKLNKYRPQNRIYAGLAYGKGSKPPDTVLSVKLGDSSQEQKQKEERHAYSNRRKLSIFNFVWLTRER